jgi:hypothetical protein
MVKTENPSLSYLEDNVICRDLIYLSIHQLQLIKHTSLNFNIYEKEDFKKKAKITVYQMTTIWQEQKREGRKPIQHRDSGSLQVGRAHFIQKLYSVSDTTLLLLCLLEEIKHPSSKNSTRILS